MSSQPAFRDHQAIKEEVETKRLSDIELHFSATTETSMTRGSRVAEGGPLAHEGIGYEEVKEESKLDDEKVAPGSVPDLKDEQGSRQVRHGTGTVW